jgi:hypothetical protein
MHSNTKHKNPNFNPSSGWLPEWSFLRNKPHGLSKFIYRHQLWFVPLVVLLWTPSARLANSSDLEHISFASAMSVGRMCWLAGRKGWGTQSLVRDSVRSDALGLRESVHCDPRDQLSRFLGPHRSGDGDFSSDAVRPFGTTSSCVGGVIDLCSSSVRDGMGCEATSHIDVLLKLSS